MLRAGKAVAVPPLRRGHRSDGFLSNSLYAGLRAGNLFGIGTEARYLQKSNRLFQFSFCIPGLSFDLADIGSVTEGYYDRFLNRYHGVNIGICYNSCIRNELPHGRFDVAASILVTEKFVKRIPAQENKPMPKKEKPLLKRSFSMADRRKGGGRSQG